MNTLYILFALGLILSLYAIHVHIQASKDKNYKSICDISNKTSCSETFTSEFGSHFGIPNGYFGVAFYLFMTALLYLDQFDWMLFFSGISLVASAYLGYLLATKVKRICIDCISIYIVNIATFLILWNMVQ
jgi:uncharacterized membrane protein